MTAKRLEKPEKGRNKSKIKGLRSGNKKAWRAPPEERSPRRLRRSSLRGIKRLCLSGEGADWTELWYDPLVGSLFLLHLLKVLFESLEAWITIPNDPRTGSATQVIASFTAQVVNQV